jgi:hypothetical protein
MNQELIDMAKQAGLIVATGFKVGPGTSASVSPWRWGVDEIEAFAALVAAAEREACAKIFDGFTGTEWFAENVAEELRAIGKTK